jgi:hypothetical protein
MSQTRASTSETRPFAWVLHSQVPCPSIISGHNGVGLGGDDQMKIMPPLANYPYFVIQENLKCEKETTDGH